jgi:hypothetical protein
MFNKLFRFGFGTILPIQLILFLTYVGNIYQLTQCDFDGSKSWKGEVIHGIGAFGVPSFIVTAFTNFDEN